MESPKTNASSWTVDEVCKWLTGIGLGKYSPIFKLNDITGKHLLQLTKEELHVDLKIDSLGNSVFASSI
jgi:hypothetical protein